jgi:hypothetical protein
MARVSGNVVGNLHGKLGNLSARTRNGRTIFSARPSSFNTSYAPVLVETRAKFAVSAAFSSAILSLSALAEIWNAVKKAGTSAFNTIIQSNFNLSSTEKPTDQNIITPDGFPLAVTTAAVDADKVTASLPALNTAAVISSGEVKLSANALIVYHTPAKTSDQPYRIVVLSKEISPFDFTAPYSLEIDLDPVQKSVASRYGKYILYVAVATTDDAGNIVQHSSTYAKASA